MRVAARVMVFAALATVVVGMAGGQQPGGGFGKGKGGANDYFGLVNNGQVKAELKITDDQAAKLPAAGVMHPPV